MAIDFTALNTELARETDISTAIDTMVDKLLAAITEANAGVQPAVDAVVEQFRSNNDKLNASVLKGTIADPGTPPPTSFKR